MTEDPIPKGSIWVSRGRRARVQVVNLARHGEDCASRFVLYTNLEPYGAHKVFPCFNQPDIKATYTMTVEAPNYYAR